MLSKKKNEEKTENNKQNECDTRSRWLLSVLFLCLTLSKLKKAHTYDDTFRYVYAYAHHIEYGTERSLRCIFVLCCCFEEAFCKCPCAKLLDDISKL